MNRVDGLVAGIAAQDPAIDGAGFIPNHRPAVEDNGRQYLVDCIDSNFASSVGPRVAEFEQHIRPVRRARKIYQGDYRASVGCHRGWRKVSVRVYQPLLLALDYGKSEFHRE